MFRTLCCAVVMGALAMSMSGRCGAETNPGALPASCRGNPKGQVDLNACAEATEKTLPAACRTNADGVTDYQACVDSTAKGSPWRTWALINLGSQAFTRYDWKNAARFYDEARPAGGGEVYSDATFHAFRGASYAHMGRDADALRDARIAWLILGHKPVPGLPAGVIDYRVGPEPADVLYPLVLPILSKAKDPHLAEALAAYKSLPATDWIALSNRAATLNELGDTKAALADDREALRLAPDEPSVLNNTCDLYTADKHAAEALPFCEKALSVAPKMAAIHDTYASALEQVGRCKEARLELAEALRLDPVSEHYRRSLKCAGAS